MSLETVGRVAAREGAKGGRGVRMTPTTSADIIIRYRRIAEHTPGVVSRARCDISSWLTCNPRALSINSARESLNTHLSSLCHSIVSVPLQVRGERPIPTGVRRYYKRLRVIFDIFNKYARPRTAAF